MLSSHVQLLFQRQQLSEALCVKGIIHIEYRVAKCLASDLQPCSFCFRCVCDVLLCQRLVCIYDVRHYCLYGLA